MVFDTYEVSQRHAELNEVRSNEDTPKRRIPYRQIVTTFLIEAILSSYLYSYAAYFLWLESEIYYGLDDALWTIVFYTATTNIFTPTIKTYYKQYFPWKNKYFHKNTMLLSIVCLSFILIALANVPMTWVLHDLVFGVFGGFYTSIISYVLRKNNSFFFKPHSRFLYNYVCQYAKALSLAVTPVSTLYLINLIGYFYTMLTLSMILLISITICLTLQNEKPTYPSEIELNLLELFSRGHPIPSQHLVNPDPDPDVDQDFSSKERLNQYLIAIQKMSIDTDSPNIKAFFKRIDEPDSRRQFQYKGPPPPMEKEKGKGKRTRTYQRSFTPKQEPIPSTSQMSSSIRELDSKKGKWGKGRAPLPSSNQKPFLSKLLQSCIPTKKGKGIGKKLQTTQKKSSNQTQESASSTSQMSSTYRQLGSQEVLDSTVHLDSVSATWRSGKGIKIYSPEELKKIVQPPSSIQKSDTAEVTDADSSTKEEKGVDKNIQTLHITQPQESGPSTIEILPSTGAIKKVLAPKTHRTQKRMQRSSQNPSTSQASNIFEITEVITRPNVHIPDSDGPSGLYRSIPMHTSSDYQVETMQQPSQNPLTTRESSTIEITTRQNVRVPDSDVASGLNHRILLDRSADPLAVGMQQLNQYPSTSRAPDPSLNRSIPMQRSADPLAVGMQQTSQYPSTSRAPDPNLNRSIPMQRSADPLAMGMQQPSQYPSTSRAPDPSLNRSIPMQRSADPLAVGMQQASQYPSTSRAPDPSLNRSIPMQRSADPLAMGMQQPSQYPSTSRAPDPSLNRSIPMQRSADSLAVGMQQPSQNPSTSRASNTIENTTRQNVRAPDSDVASGLNRSIPMQRSADSQAVGMQQPSQNPSTSRASNTIENTTRQNVRAPDSDVASGLNRSIPMQRSADSQAVGMQQPSQNPSTSRAPNPSLNRSIPIHRSADPLAVGMQQPNQNPSTSRAPNPSLNRSIPIHRSADPLALGMQQPSQNPSTSRAANPSLSRSLPIYRSADPLAVGMQQPSQNPSTSRAANSSLNRNIPIHRSADPLAMGMQQPSQNPSTSRAPNPSLSRSLPIHRSADPLAVGMQQLSQNPSTSRAPNLSLSRSLPIHRSADHLAVGMQQPSQNPSTSRAANHSLNRNIPIHRSAGFQAEGMQQPGQNPSTSRASNPIEIIEILTGPDVRTPDSDETSGSNQTISIHTNADSLAMMSSDDRSAPNLDDFSVQEDNALQPGQNTESTFTDDPSSSDLGIEIETYIPSSIGQVSSIGPMEMLSDPGLGNEIRSLDDVHQHDSVPQFDEEAEARRVAAMEIISRRFGSSPSKLVPDSQATTSRGQLRRRLDSLDMSRSVSGLNRGFELIDNEDFLVIEQSAGAGNNRGSFNMRLVKNPLEFSDEDELRSDYASPQTDSVDHQIECSDSQTEEFSIKKFVQHKARSDEMLLIDHQEMNKCYTLLRNSWKTLTIVMTVVLHYLIQFVVTRNLSIFKEFKNIYMFLFIVTKACVTIYPILFIIYMGEAKLCKDYYFQDVISQLTQSSSNGTGPTNHTDLTIHGIAVALNETNFVRNVTDEAMSQNGWSIDKVYITKDVSLNRDRNLLSNTTVVNTTEVLRNSKNGILIMLSQNACLTIQNLIWTVWAGMTWASILTLSIFVLRGLNKVILGYVFAIPISVSCLATIIFSLPPSGLIKIFDIYGYNFHFHLPSNIFSSPIFIGVVFGIGPAMLSFFDKQVYKNFINRHHWKRCQYLIDVCSGLLILLYYSILKIINYNFKSSYQAVLWHSFYYHMLIPVVWFLLICVVSIKTNLLKYIRSFYTLLRSPS